MERPELIKMFQQMATEIAEKDYSHVTEESVIAELGIDSLAMLELVGSMERELKITIPDEKLVGAAAIHRLLAGWRRDLQRADATPAPVVPAGAPESARDDAPRAGPR